MQFSDTTDKLGIIQACERYCNLGDAAISGNATLLREFTAQANTILRRVWHSIFMSYGGWQYDDGNQTDLPAATTATVASQTSYPLPSGALTVRGVEIKDESGIWNALTPLTEELVRNNTGSFAEFNDVAGQPRYYQMVGNSVRIFPATDYAQAASVKIWFDRGSVAFDHANTSTTPGFASEYHDIVPIGASLEYLKIKTPNDAVVAQLRADYATIDASIREYYAKRFMEYTPARLTVRDAMRDAF